MKEPWSPAQATDELRRIARDARLSLAYKLHATKRACEREISTSDVLYVLKNGFVYHAAKTATRPDYFKYEIESRTPNSDGRIVNLVVIPDCNNMTIKLVTIMWKDEDARRAGTLTEG